MTYYIGAGNAYIAKLNDDGSVDAKIPVRSAEINPVLITGNEGVVASVFAEPVVWEFETVGVGKSEIFNRLFPPLFTCRIFYRHRINWMCALLLLGRPDLARWFRPYWYLSRVEVRPQYK